MKESLSAAIYEIAGRIPKGRATSYGAIAKAIGYPQHSRLVGKIMGECDSSTTNIPAHRVVNSQGYLSAKDSFKTPTLMQELLESEGVTIVNNKIKNWKSVFWNPLDEIAIDR